MRKENPADIAIFEENAKRPFGMRDMRREILQMISLL